MPAREAVFAATGPRTGEGLEGFLGRPVREILARIAGISDRDWQRAEEHARSTGRNPPRPELALVELGLISPDILAKALAARWGLPYSDLEGVVPRPEALALVGPDVLRTGLVLPLEATDSTLRVAIADPERLDLRDRLHRDAGTRRLELVVSTEEKIRTCLATLDRPAEEETLADLSGSEDPSEDLANAPPVVRLVGEIINQAIARGASDVHIGVWDTAPEVRYRIDGHLRHVMYIPHRMFRGVISRIKVLSRLDIAEHRFPQDGECKWSDPRGRRWDLRVTTLPGRKAEHVAIRIFGHTASPDLARLGFDGELLCKLEELCSVRSGIILVTGPTGSGKSTTLATMLSRIQQIRPEDAIYTVEDPVEILVPGAIQIQVIPKAGLTFPRVLRSLLRADPDVIEIGEIRDQETAEIAIRAALTGHLVLSTLHTNDAPTAVTRLLDMGIESYLLRDTLRGVLAQRLVRRVCERCGVEVELSDEEGTIVPGLSVRRERRGTGCPACHGGYRGRMAIAELLTVTPEIAELVGERAPAREIRRRSGMRSMAEDGARKVMLGLTTVEEVRRAVAIETAA